MAVELTITGPDDEDVVLLVTLHHVISSPTIDGSNADQLCAAEVEYIAVGGAFYNVMAAFSVDDFDTVVTTEKRQANEIIVGAAFDTIRSGSAVVAVITWVFGSNTESVVA